MSDDNDPEYDPVLDGYITELLQDIVVPGPSVWVWVSISLAHGQLAAYYPDHVALVVNAVKTWIADRCKSDHARKVLARFNKLADENRIRKAVQFIQQDEADFLANKGEYSGS